MERENIIIIEGAQGVGKSTMTTFLRDNLPSTNLYRLSGIKDKTITGYEKNKKMYLNLIDYMKSLEGCRLNLVFDRTFFSEEVYASLGYKDYKFDDVYDTLVNNLNKLDYNIYFVVLYLEDTSIYEKRLKRNHHTYHDFSIQSSIDQQNKYLELLDNIKLDNIHTLKIKVDNYKEAYDTLIRSIPVLKESGIIYEEN